jgi:tetratricopeptide (TPR) repeat protein
MKSVLFIVLLNFFIFDSLYASYDDIDDRIAAFKVSKNLKGIYDLGKEIRDKANKSSEDQETQCKLYNKALNCFELSIDLDINKPNALHNCGMIYWKTGNREEAEYYFVQAVVLGSEASERNLDKLKKMIPTKRMGVNNTEDFKGTLKVMGPVCLAFASDLTIDAIAHASRVLLGPGWGMFIFALIESRHTIPYWSSLQPYVMIAISRTILGSVIKTFS